MSIDSVSIEYNLVYQASATFAQPLTLSILGDLPSKPYSYLALYFIKF
jgi:hypothetical protein